MVTTDKLTETVETIKKGGLEKYHQKMLKKESFSYVNG